MEDQGIESSKLPNNNNVEKEDYRQRYPLSDQRDNYIRDNYTRNNNDPGRRNYNNNNYNNNRNNNNRNYNNQGRNRNNNFNNNFNNNNKQRHQNKARAALPNTLVECSLPSLPLSADGKVFKQVLKEGDGPSPSPSSVVHINYVCRVTDGSVLDAFVDPQLPTVININKATLTPALEMCLLGMKIGEKCLLTTSFEHGYGELGCPPRIPPRSILQYEIELFWFAQEYSVWDDGTVAGKLAAAEQAKLAGNHFFKLKMDRAAVRNYKAGESRLDSVSVNCSEEEQKKVDQMLVFLNLNLAASALQTKMYDMVIINCDKVLTLDPSNTKGLFRLSRAYAGLLDFKTAKATLMKAINLKPNDISLREEYEALRKKERNAKQNAEGSLRGVFNKENSLELFTETEMEDMKKSQIALAGATMFV